MSRHAWLRLLVALGLLGLLGACQCARTPPPPPPNTCERDIDCPVGQRCADAGRCQTFAGCQSDADCEVDEQCRVVDGSCRLRPGFGRECRRDGECYPGFFCALGRCRDAGEAFVCATAFDCPIGFRCDRGHFFCIEDVPCTLAEAYPEVSCDPGQRCDSTTVACLLDGPSECTPDNQATTCGPDELCDGSGRCVQCTVNAHCGPGLRCNSRAGRCESEELCHSDSDCEPPLICDPLVSLCRVPLPPCGSDLDCAAYEYCDRESGLCSPLAGACHDDRLEQNDSPLGAHASLDDGDETLLDQLEVCPDDDDYFRVVLAAGDGLRAQVLSSDSHAGVELELYAPDQVTRLRQSFAPPQGNGSVSFSANEAGDYYVRVLSRTQPSPYDLQLQRFAGQPCQADALEGALGNDSAASAATITAGHYADLSLCSGDVDHLRLALAAGEGLRVQVQARAGLDPDLMLTDADSGHALVSASSSGPLERLSYRSVEDRRVDVQVRAYRGAPESYDLDVQITPPYLCQPDSLEGVAGNNSADRATLVAQSLSQQSLSLCSGDADWFVVARADYQRLVAQATFDSADLDLDLEVYLDPQAEPVTVSRSGLGAEAISLPASGADERVWLRVLAADGAFGPYSLSLFTEHGADCAADADEPNETAAQAKTAPPSGQYSLCGFDEDVFVVALEAGKTVQARVQFSPAEGDLDLQLLHPDGRTALATSDGVGAIEQVTYTAQVDGDHYLRVYALSSDPRARYLLSVQVVDAIP